jgi:hypothetical protein
MKKTIDCLLIGHNEMDFDEYEESIAKMGLNSGAYRDLEKNFIRYNNRPYHISDVFNIFCCSHEDSPTHFKPITMGENFSLTIAYLGTYLNRSGITFDYINAFREEKEELAEKLVRENILTIAIITTLYVSALPVLDIMRFVKKYNKTAKIIIGGPFISNQLRALRYLLTG